MPGSFRVARLFGIELRIHVSWVVIFGLVFFSLWNDVFPSQYPFWSDQKTLLVSAITAVLFFCSIVAHELSHSLVARRFHMRVSSITLFLLGGVANLQEEPPSAKAEFYIAAAGPFMSLCKRCHDSTKRMIETRGFRPDIGLDGWPLDPNHPVYRRAD